MILSALFSTFALGAVELTPDNFDDVVYNSGKGAFVKFLAPWWGHCKKMKPDWDKLAEKFKDSDVVTVADVDCTAAGEKVCSKVGVEGYPTIKYWIEGNPKAKDYNGGRSFDALESFAKKTVQKPCDVKTQGNCSDDQKKFIDGMKGKDAQGEFDAKTKELTDAKANRQKLETEFKAANKERKKNEAELQKTLGLLGKLAKAAKVGKEEL